VQKARGGQWYAMTARNVLALDIGRKWRGFMIV
jgi:hypothetical protein